MKNLPRDARLVEPLDSLAEVMRLYSWLHYYGLGPTEPRDKLPAAREQLRRSEDEVIQVAEWLAAHVQPTRKRVVSSYRMKHVVENEIHSYVSNGQLIAAALMVGYPMQYTDSPNPLFGMSRESV